MEIDKLKEYVKLNESGLPLAFKAITVKDKTREKANVSVKPLKATRSKLYRDNDYLVITFYKPITQFI